MPRHHRFGDLAARNLFVIPAVLYIVFYYGLPVVQNTLMSFGDVTIKSFVTGEAPWVGFDNYVAMFRDRVFRKALGNTFLFTAGSMTMQFLLGLGLALFFKRHFPLNGVIRSFLLLPWLLPLIAGTAVWRLILDQDNGILNLALMGAHVIDKPIGWLTDPHIALRAVMLVNIWVGVPFHLSILYTGLQSIPSEHYEAASLDGASGWQSFWHITLPALRPVMTVGLVLGVIYTLKVLDIILGLTGGGPANSTQTLGTFSYFQSFERFKFGAGAAVSNVLIVISLMFTVLYLVLSRRGDER